MKLNPNEIRALREMLKLIFPEVSPISSRFLMRLTPNELKQAFMRQAAIYHPKKAEGLSEKAQKAHHLHYKRLFNAYKASLPRVKAIHERVQKTQSRWKIEHPVDEAPDKTILAVGGAKGGVGKSVLSANLSVGLALLGQRVVLADLDLGGADVHLYVGVKSLSKSWKDFLEMRVKTVKSILTPTPFDGLTLIGGNSSKLGSANLPYSQTLRIIRHLKALECDYIIMDLGGNTSLNVLDFFLIADQKIVVTGTEPASILDSYSFVKVAFLRFLERFFVEYKSLENLYRRVSRGNLDEFEGNGLESIFQEVRATDPTAYVNLKERFDQFRLSIVVNMTENRKDLHIAESMKRLLKERCFMDAGVLGTIPFDRGMRKAVRRFTPIVIEDPRSQASQVLHQMLASILLLREPKEIRSALFKKTNLIRSGAKDMIGAGAMTLNGLTATQIDAIFDQSLKIQQGLRKILTIMTNRK